MKILNLLILLQMLPLKKDPDWIIKPTYEEIVAYSKNVFLAKANKKFFIKDFDEKKLYTFEEKDIYEITGHMNEGGELQSIVNVRYLNNTMRLFNIETLKFLTEKRYYLLQTTDYYTPERKLIRMFDDLKEGVMTYDGQILLPPIYEEVSIQKDVRIGYNEKEIIVFDSTGQLLKTLPYIERGARFIASKKYLKVQKEIKGESNIYEEKRKQSEKGHYYVEYENIESEKFASGIINLT